MMTIGLQIEDYLHQYGDELGYNADELLDYDKALDFLKLNDYKGVDLDGILLCKDGFYHKCEVYKDIVVTTHEDIENNIKWELTYDKDSIVCNALFAKEFRRILDKDFVKQQVFISSIQDLQLEAVSDI